VPEKKSALLRTSRRVVASYKRRQEKHGEVTNDPKPLDDNTTEDTMAVSSANFRGEWTAMADTTARTLNVYPLRL